MDSGSGKKKVRQERKASIGLDARKSRMRMKRVASVVVAGRRTRQDGQINIEIRPFAVIRIEFLNNPMFELRPAAQASTLGPVWVLAEHRECCHWRAEVPGQWLCVCVSVPRSEAAAVM